MWSFFGRVGEVWLKVIGMTQLRKDINLCEKFLWGESGLLEDIR